MKLVAAMMLACGALLLMRAATASSGGTLSFHLPNLINAFLFVSEMTSGRNDPVKIVKYNFSYEVSDGTEGEEEGVLKNVGTDAEVLSVNGWFRWKDYTHGFIWMLDYEADEKGFRVVEEPGLRTLHPHVVASLLGGK